MRSSILLAVPVAAAFLGAACSGLEPLPDAPDGGGEQAAVDSGEQGPAGTGLGTGLPCDVQAIVENRCIACHSTNEPPKLLTFDDFMAKSRKDPSKTLAQVTVDLLKAKTMPPAPAAPPEADEIESFETWVNEGTKRNAMACTDPPPTGTPDAGPVIDGGDGGDAGEGGTGCTSGKTWPAGSPEGPLMNPGQPCNACHQVMGGPNLRIAGTVYPTLKEPNNCIGSAPPPQITVTVTDARNRTFNMQVNASGNFLYQGNGLPPRAPFRAVVTEGGKRRAMQGSVTSGDCNSCHTQNGLNNAPGRIMAP